MTVKLGYKEFVRNLWLNLLMVLQLAVVFFLIVLFVSTTAFRFRLYTPFEKELTAQGSFVRLDGFLHYTQETGRPLTEDEIIAQNEYVKDVVSTSYVGFSLPEYPSASINTCGYDLNLIECVHPRLESGVWLDQAERETGVVNAVITGNRENLKTGDMIAADFFGVDGNPVALKLLIIGVLSDGVTLPMVNDYTPTIDPGEWDYRDFYTTYSFKQTEDEYLFLDMRDVLENNLHHIIQGKAFVVYQDGISDAQRLRADAALEGMGLGEYVPMELINQNSMSYIWDQISILLPIIVAVLILILTSSFCINAVHAKRQIRNYCVYYMNGSRWMQCGLINIWSALIVTGLATALCGLGCLILSASGLFVDLVITFGAAQILTCMGIALLNLLFSCAIPFALLKHVAPKEVLSTNR